MANFTLFAIFFFSSIIFFGLFVLTWIIFGRLLKLQIKRWLLASRGYVEVEHISATKVRNYFIMRPSNNKFDIDDGFFHYIPECINRKGDLIKKITPALLSKMPEIPEEELVGLSDKERKEFESKKMAEWEELNGLYKAISKLRYDPELLNRKMGMPVITYYGDNPDPLNPAERTKEYGSGVIKDMYLRLLLTQRYNDFKFMMTIFLVAIGLTAIATIGLWRAHTGDVSNYAHCLSMLNESQTNWIALTNKTIQASLQSSTVVVG